MIKQIMNGFSKFFTKERVIILIAFLILSWALYSYNGSKNTIIDGYDSMEPGNFGNFEGSQYSPSMTRKVDSQPQPNVHHLPTGQNQPLADNQNKPIAPSQPKNSAPSAPSQPKIIPTSSNNSDVASPSDLLPKDSNSQWATLNPLHSGSSVMTPDLLSAGYHIGLESIGQNIRNPNLQLRSDPIITKTDTGPWNMSTIEPDISRVPLELGGYTN